MATATATSTANPDLTKIKTAIAAEITAETRQQTILEIKKAILAKDLKNWLHVQTTLTKLAQPVLALLKEAQKDLGGDVIVHPINEMIIDKYSFHCAFKYRYHGNPFFIDWFKDKEELERGKGNMTCPSIGYEWHIGTMENTMTFRVVVFYVWEQLLSYTCTDDAAIKAFSEKAAKPTPWPHRAVKYYCSANNEGYVVDSIPHEHGGDWDYDQLFSTVDQVQVYMMDVIKDAVRLGGNKHMKKVKEQTYQDILAPKMEELLALPTPQALSQNMKKLSQDIEPFDTFLQQTAQDHKALLTITNTSQLYADNSWYEEANAGPYPGRMRNGFLTAPVMSYTLSYKEIIIRIHAVYALARFDDIWNVTTGTVSEKITKEKYTAFLKKVKDGWPHELVFYSWIENSLGEHLHIRTNAYSYSSLQYYNYTEDTIGGIKEFVEHALDWHKSLERY